MCRLSVSTARAAVTMVEAIAGHDRAAELAKEMGVDD